MNERRFPRPCQRSTHSLVTREPCHRLMMYGHSEALDAYASYPLKDVLLVGFTQLRSLAVSGKANPFH
jgi:hypothetical protein